MAHNRRIVLGGVSLTPVRLNRAICKVSSEVIDDIEALMLQSGYCDQAPFRWVGLVFRYGLINEEEPHYKQIDSIDGELPLAIELDAQELRAASQEELRQKLSLGALKALIHAGKKFRLPTNGMENRYRQLAGGDNLPR